MVLVGHKNDNNRLKVRKKMDWMVWHSGCKYLPQRLLAIRKSVIVSPVFPFYTLRKKRETETVSVKIASHSSQDSLLHWSIDAALIS